MALPMHALPAALTLPMALAPQQHTAAPAALLAPLVLVRPPLSPPPPPPSQQVAQVGAPPPAQALAGWRALAGASPPAASPPSAVPAGAGDSGSQSSRSASGVALRPLTPDELAVQRAVEHMFEEAYAAVEDDFLALLRLNRQGWVPLEVVAARLHLVPRPSLAEVATAASLSAVLVVNDVDGTVRRKTPMRKITLNHTQNKTVVFDRWARDMSDEAVHEAVLAALAGWGPVPLVRLARGGGGGETHSLRAVVPAQRRAPDARYVAVMFPTTEYTAAFYAAVVGKAPPSAWLDVQAAERSAAERTATERAALAAEKSGGTPRATGTPVAGDGGAAAGAAAAAPPPAAAAAASGSSSSSEARPRAATAGAADRLRAAAASPAYADIMDDVPHDDDVVGGAVILPAGAADASSGGSGGGGAGGGGTVVGGVAAAVPSASAAAGAGAGSDMVSLFGGGALLADGSLAAAAPCRYSLYGPGAAGAAGASCSVPPPPASATLDSIVAAIAAVRALPCVLSYTPVLAEYARGGRSDSAVSSGSAGGLRPRRSDASGRATTEGDSLSMGIIHSGGASTVASGSGSGIALLEGVPSPSMARGGGDRRPPSRFVRDRGSSAGSGILLGLPGDGGGGGSGGGGAPLYDAYKRKERYGRPPSGSGDSALDRDFGEVRWHGHRGAPGTLSPGADTAAHLPPAGGALGAALAMGALAGMGGVPLLGSGSSGGGGGGGGSGSMTPASPPRPIRSSTATAAGGGGGGGGSPAHGGANLRRDRGSSDGAVLSTGFPYAGGDELAAAVGADALRPRWQVAARRGSAGAGPPPLPAYGALAFAGVPQYTAPPAPLYGPPPPYGAVAAVLPPPPPAAAAAVAAAAAAAAPPPSAASVARGPTPDGSRGFSRRTPASTPPR